MIIFESLKEIKAKLADLRPFADSGDGIASLDEITERQLLLDDVDAGLEQFSKEADYGAIKSSAAALRQNLNKCVRPYQYDFSGEAQIRLEWQNAYYVGEVSEGTANGKGRAYLKDKSYYEGNFTGGTLSGLGTYTTKTGIVYSGSFYDFELFRGQIKYPNGAEYKGKFNEGLPTGAGSLTLADGRVFEGTFSTGDIQEGVVVYENGDKYEGAVSGSHAAAFDDFEMSGVGKYTFKTGDVYDGPFVNDVFCGNGILTYSSGARYEGAFKDGVCCGKGTLYSLDGTKYEGNFSGGEPNGEGTKYAKDGKVLYEGNWKDGKEAPTTEQLNYKAGIEALSKKKWAKAYELLSSCGNYRDAKEKCQIAKSHIKTPAPPKPKAAPAPAKTSAPAKPKTTAPARPKTTAPARPSRPRRRIRLRLPSLSEGIGFYILYVIPYLLMVLTPILLRSVFHSVFYLPVMVFGVCVFFSLTINQMDYENNIKPMKHRIIFQVVYYVFTFIGMFIFNYNFLNFLITGGVIALVVNVGTFDVINDGWWYAFKYGFVAATWVALIGIERMLPGMLYNNLWNSFWFAPLVLLVMAALMGVVTMVILNDNEGHGGLVICGMLATAAMLLIRCYTLIGRAYEFDFGMFMYYIIFTAVFLGGGFIGMSIGFGLGQVVDDNT